MSGKQSKNLNRRQFTKAAAATTLAAPVIVPSSVFGKDAPSNKITMGCIGVGWQGGGNMGRFLGIDDCRVLAVSDTDKNHLRNAQNRVNRKYKNKDCKAYDDFRDLLARKDIDAVMMALPDHWHAIPAIIAANSKKDVFGEKPISHTLREGRAMADAMAKNKRIWQTGSWQRSVFNFRQGVELVHNGHIGKVKRVEVGLPSGHADFNRTGNKCPDSDPPKELNYDMWIGPAKMEPYNRCRSHKNWRWNYNIGGGQLMDWIGHHCDIAHWGLADTEFGIGPDDKIGPLTVEGKGDFPDPKAIWNTCTKYRINCQYPNGVEVVIAGGHRDIGGGTKWIGEDGNWVHVNRGRFKASNPEWTKRKFERGSKKAYYSQDHWRNFIECCKTRKPTITPAEVAHRSATPGHLGLLSMRLGGKKLNWDAKTETVTNDKSANGKLGKNMRAPWKIDSIA